MTNLGPFKKKKKKNLHGDQNNSFLCILSRCCVHAFGRTIDTDGNISNVTHTNAIYRFNIQFFESSHLKYGTHRPREFKKKTIKIVLRSHLFL